MKILRHLLDRHRAYHQHDQLMLWYAGVLGTVAFPLFYLLRYVKQVPVYDDLWLRLTAAAVCALLMLRKRWPRRLQPYFYDYSYFGLIFTLPFAFVFTSLKNGGGTVAVGNTLMAIIFVIFLTDWRNTIAMVTAGFAAAVLAYVAFDPNPTLPADYVARLPILLLVLVGGIFFKLAVERATAEKVRQAYASIAGSIAHEMRNPLSRIGHSLENLQTMLPAPGAAAQPLKDEQLDALYRHVADGEQAVRRGLQVISMTLDEVSAKPLDSSGFALLSAAEVVEKAVREYGYDTDEARERVTVAVLDDFSFRGDETAFLFVLFNLLKNALYYTTPYPQTRITVQVGQGEVSVHDTGPGIAPETLKELFEPFRSVAKSGGTGLGLAYCRRVMDAFGGSIECASELGRFTRFTLRFPPVSEAEAEAHREEVIDAARRVLAGRQVLLVDDDAAQRMTTRHKLRPLAASLEEAADGQRALECLARRPFDLVLLDMNMPVMDGYTLAEKLRRGEAPGNTDVRIVAYTSEPAHVARMKVEKARMDGYIGKPASQLALLQALQRAMEAPRTRAAAAARPLAGRRIILADDSPYNRRAVAAYLRNAGAVVQEADHGARVLELLRAGSADAVLLDLEMPGLGGEETARAIRGSTHRWASIPLVALTAHSDSAAMVAAQAAGMNGFLVKPVEAGLLYQALNNVLQGWEPGSAPTPRTDAGALLNLARLDSYRRLGLLEELVADYVPEIARLVSTLNRTANERQLQATLDALHSLLGMSGEAGAQLLHQRVRQYYLPMLERRDWPSEPGWVGQLAGLARQTEQALLTYAATPTQAGAPG